MTLKPRQFLELAGAATFAPLFGESAFSQAYPNRPVRWLVGYPPGGATDIAARVIGHWLSEHLGQQFIIENRPGASGNVATQAVVNAPPDGYMLLLVNAGNAINETLYQNLKFNFVKDIAPVASVVRVPLVMEVNPSVPAKTVPEFIAYAKANPGKLNVASAGNGTPQHLAGELFKMMAGVNLTHVPYRGSAPALADLIAGQVQVAFDTTAASIGFVKAGKLRALAVTTSTRSAALPDVPALGDFVPGYEASGWYGVGAPKNTPREIVDKLNQNINAALGDAEVQARFTELGATVFKSSPAEFGAFIAADTEKWAKVIQFSGTKAD